MIKGQGKYFTIPGYDEGYPLTLLNTIYHKPRKMYNKKTKKEVMIPPILDLVCIDNNTNEKFIANIFDPTYDYFLIKPEYRVNYNQFTVPIEECDRISVPNTELLKSIAENTNNLNFYYENLKNKNFKNNSVLHTHTSIMMSDTQIEDHYRWKFSNTYQNEYCNFHKAFFDIEVAAELAKGDFPEPGEVPVTAIAYIDEKTRMIHQFNLRMESYTQMPEYEEEIKRSNGQMKEFIEILTNHVGGIDKFIEYELDKFSYNMEFFDDELELIKRFFDYVHYNSPDFMLAWNMRFDIPYLIARLKALGVKPEDIICDPDFLIKDANYFIDDFFQKSEEQRDFFFCSSKTVYLDHLIQFASMRKGRGALEELKLDYIGELVCGIHKLDYHAYAKDLKKLPFNNYKIFSYYNIIDTIVEYCIEKTVSDLNSIFSDVLVNNTRYPYIFKQSIYLKNRACKSNFNDGLVFTNNVNKNNTKTPFSGGYKSDPNKNGNFSKICVNGQYLPIYDKLNDFDYKSMYPMIILLFNIGMETLICHINIPTNVLLDKFRNRFGREEKAYVIEGQFTEDLQSHNWIEFFSRWFRFGTYSEVIDDVIEYFTKVKLPNGRLGLHNSDGKMNAFVKGPDDLNKWRRNAFIKIMTEEDLDIADRQLSYEAIDYTKYGAVSNNPRIVDFETMYEAYNNQYRLQYLENRSVKNA